MFFKLIKFFLLCIKLCDSVNLNLLPETMIPTHYELQIGVDLTTKTFTGELSIQLDIFKATNEILLNSRSLVIDRVELKDSSGNFKRIVSQNNSLFEIVQFKLNETVQTGSYKLSLSYSGDISNTLKGLYVSRYFKDGVERHIATTFFAPNHARMVFPCFDEPKYKATFSLTVFHSKEYHALSNMPVQDVRKVPFSDTLLLTVFEKTPPMSTYTLAFVVSDFVRNTNPNGNFSVYSHVNALNYTNLSNEFGQRSLRTLENFLNSSFQLSKLDFIAIDDFLMGAMENWGLITFKSSKLLFRKDETNSRIYQNIFTIISHELSHQWFGNDVTCSWWSHTWLNEGFASFFEYYITSILKPDWKIMDQFNVMIVQNSLSNDADLNVRSMNSEIKTTDDLDTIYDFVSYKKAGSIIRMMQHVIGEENFQNALRSYISDRKQNISTPNDLYRHFDKFNQTTKQFTIKEIFSSWADNPGYPVINVIRNYINGTLKITQRRFIADTQLKLVENKFYIPLNYFTEKYSIKSTSAMYWLTPMNDSIEIPFMKDHQWVIFNNKQTGYYRVNYDNTNWKILIEHLKHKDLNAIDSVNRAQLIDDSYNLAKYNNLTFNITLDLLSYIKRENELVPFMSALPALDFLMNQLKAHQKYYLIENYTHTIIRAPFKYVQKMDYNKIDHLNKLLRMEIYKFACKYDLAECINDGGGNLKSDIDLRLTRFCMDAKNLNSMNSDLNLIRRLNFITSSKANYYENLDELNEVISAMGCAKNKIIIQSFLNISCRTDNYMENEDRQKIFTSILRSSYNNSKLALDFLLTMYEKAQINYESMPAVWKAIGNSILNDELHQKFETIIKVNKDLITFEEKDAIQIAIRQLDAHLNWIDKHSREIFDWIETDFNQNYYVKDDGNGDYRIKPTISVLVLNFVVLYIYFK